MRILAAVLSLLSFSLFSADVWIFLKDGRVGLGDPAKSPIQVALPNGFSIDVTSEQIHSQRTREQTDQAVDGMVQDIARGRSIAEHTPRLQSYRNAAVPRLLVHLKSNEPRVRLAALYALQFCYSPEAEEPVFAALNDADFDIRRTAYAALVRHLPEVELSERLVPLADGKELSTLALVFESVDRHNPDKELKRLPRLLAEPKFHHTFLNRFSRYTASKLTPATLTMLDSKNKDVVRTGVVGLISQCADDEATRAKVRGLLASTDADLRDVCAEFFTWLGKKSDLESLQKALAKETDPYAKAALEGALKIIPKRESLAAKDASALQKLRPDVLEPTLIYGLVDIADKDAVRDRLLNMQNALAAPSGSLRNSMTYLSGGPQEATTARMAPVRDFFDEKRKSFGYQMPSDPSAFSGSVHIGDDVSWRKELRSVVAVAPGIVRSVEHAYSWGFIVVVEHKLSDEHSFCSLYAHLSPLLHVKPGDTVKLGQKIGSTGRSQTVENGGYVSHLHFGLHDGPFLQQQSWVSGYIRPERWKEGQHGWLDPQVFLIAK